MSGNIIYCIEQTNKNSLSLPRWAEEVDGFTLITDSGNNRIVLVDQDGLIKCSYGGSCGTGVNQLRQPGCAIKHEDSLLISDTRNNRIIMMQWNQFVSMG